MTPLLILKCGTAMPALIARCGDYDAWFARRFARPTIVCDAWRGARPPPPGEVAGVVATGSPLSVARPEPWMADAAAYLHAAADAGVPILGVCFGHQLVAWAWGGRVAPSPRGWELGTREVRLTGAGARDPLFEGLAPRFAAHMSHRDEVAQLPPNARVLAENDHAAVQALAIGERVRGVQFHPEADATIARAFVTGRADLLRADGLDPAALAATVAEERAQERVLSNFERQFLRA